MIWFTADFHLSHKNILKYCNRPFRDINEMDEMILNNLEASVKPQDTLYYLGDLTFKIEKAKLFFEQFKDLKIHFIIGNHDNQKIINIAKKYCASISHLKNINIEEQKITLCHFAMRVWHKSHFNSWQLYGHSHGTLEPIGKQLDVGVDNNKFKPISFDQIKISMNNRPNNFNYIPSEKRHR